MVKQANWRVKYDFIVSFSDGLIVAASLFVAYCSRFPAVSLDTLDTTFLGPNYSIRIPYFVVLASILVIWFVCLTLTGSRSERVIGGGPKEYSLVAQGTILALAVTVVILFSVNSNFSRQVLFVSFIVGMPGLLVFRWFLRRFLIHRRKKSDWKDPIILVGQQSAVSLLAEELSSRYQAGLYPVGICLTDSGNEFIEALPLGQRTLRNYGGLGNVREALDETHASAVVIAEGGGLDSLQIKEISWSLDPKKHELILSSGLLDVSGPRIHTRPVAGMPLMFVEVPSFHGTTRILKRVMDLIIGTAVLIISFPVFVAIAVAIKLDDNGPVFFFQERVGLESKPFKMVKFRSMRKDAEEQKSSLEHLTMRNSPLFKMEEDPRVTRVGKFIRKWSLDEVPQVLNVIIGTMSLVGPRPPLRSEVDKYDDHVNRKFLVKPGITGLWQVSGRSNLSWEDSVRIDLYYVENWSIMTDVIILFRTFVAVLRKDGAY